MKFEIIYGLKGTRKHIVTVPDRNLLPDGWSEYTLAQKDAWIYDHQTLVDVIFEDLHHAEAESIEWAD